MQKDIIHGIKVDYSRDKLFDELGVKRLKESYMKDEEVSPQERFAFVSKTFSSNAEHAQRLYEYSSKHWLSYSTPILAFGRTKKGLPISCYLPYLSDSAEGLVDCLSEVNWLSMLGGGVGIGIGIRSSDDKSVGVMPHLKTYDASCLAYRQGRTRRGSYAAYLDISHPDIFIFLEMRKATGDQNMRCLNLHHGINITDDFMQIIEKCMIDPTADDTWELKDPNNGEIKDKVSAKDLWQRIIEMRMHTGEPYLHYIDTSNRFLPGFQKNLGLSIKQSNLCSEIILPTNKERTAVCCLSSVNLEYFDEWKDEPLFLRDIAEMLDNVLQYFIDNAPDTIARAKFSAMRERSIGVGALGFHAYLQKNNLPWESALATSANRRMFKFIREQLDKANIELGAERGEAPDAAGTGLRFSHVTAVAPNACQVKENEITTSEGIFSLGDLLVNHGIDVSGIENSEQKQWVPLRKTFMVPTLEGEKEVEQVWYNGIEEVTEIEFEDGKKYKFTENHLLLVRVADNTSRWVRVGDLTGDEEIITF
jgi:ribonucleoside-diphosphate reductase alpha chain